MIDLTTYVHQTYAANSIATKKQIATQMIEVSTAKASTKQKAMVDLAKLKSNTKIDFFVTNYMLSGEGLKVA